VAFLFGNFLIGNLRAKDEALRQAREDLERAVDAARPARLAGTVLGGLYELGEMLGRGGMGEVYQATRLTDGRSVAVKVLNVEVAASARMRERFRREADIIARLPAAHVAPARDFGIDDEGRQFIVMDLLKGEDLGALLRRRGELPLEDVVALAERSAAALDAAHELGVVHRDLKPENLFLLGGAEVGFDLRVLDFGVARLLDDSQPGLTQAATVLGTPGYLAPEQARGELAEIGPHTDVFALGAILYRALTGRNAFPARAVSAAIYQALHHEPRPPSSVRAGLPDGIDDVLTLALAKRPEDRYARAPHLARDLRAAARGQLPEESRRRARDVRARMSAVSPPAGETLAVADTAELPQERSL